MRQIITIVLLITALSCSSTDRVRQKAIQYREHSALDSTLDFFACSYYRLPYDTDEIIDFLERWRAVDTDALLFTRDFVGYDMVDYLKHKRILVSTYTDSAFIYYPKGHIGGCLYGHPLYWLKHPEEWPEERLDYPNHFSPSVFDNDGHFVYNIYDFDAIMEELQQEYMRQMPDLIANTKEFYLIVEIIPKDRRILYHCDDFNGTIQTPERLADLLFASILSVVDCGRVSKIIMPVQIHKYNYQTLKPID